MTRKQGIFGIRAPKNKRIKLTVTYRGIMGEKFGGEIVRLSTVILTKVRSQSINDVAIPDRASNKFRGDAVRLGHVYICDVTHDEIQKTIFSRK